MSTLLKEYEVWVAMFFWLNFPVQALKTILRDAGFAEAPSPPTIQVPPPAVLEISVGPPRQTLAVYKSVKADWVPDKFMLGLGGTATDVLEVLERLRDSFERHKYPLDQVCHYYEITLPPQPVDLDGFVEKLRQRLGIEVSLGGEKLRPFSISLSNFDMPVTREKFYKWLYVSLNPDANSPNRRVFIQVVKRETRFNNVVEFVRSINKVINEVIGFIEGA